MLIYLRFDNIMLIIAYSHLKISFIWKKKNFKVIKESSLVVLAKLK